MLQVFDYDGARISFDKDDEVLVNATEMARYFGKQPSDWTKNKQSQEFLDSLSTVRKISVTELIVVKQGGVTQGTWMHQDVAIEFARWLSPAFAIWCNDRIKELMQFGATALKPDDLMDPDFIIKLAHALKQSRAEADKLRNITALQSAELEIQAPKVVYHDTVLMATNLVSSTEVANELGFASAKALHKFLKDKKVLRIVNDAWALCANYSGLNYAKYRTFSYTDSQGQTKAKHHLYWTEEGRKFLHQFKNKQAC